MIIKESLLSKIFVAIFTDKRSFPCMNPVVDVKMRLSSISLLAYGAYKWLLSCVHSHMLLK
jgi:hypothetical protein